MFHRTYARALIGPGAACLFAIGGPSAAAQAADPGRAPGLALARSDQAEGPATLRLTLGEALRLGLEHNVDLTVDRIDPQISDLRVAQASSAFAPTVSTTLERNSQLAPPTSFLVGLQGVQTSTFASSINMTQRLPWAGSSYAIAWDSSRTETDSLFSNFNPSLGSRLQVTFSQPLLRDLPIDGARQQLIVSRRNRDIAGTRLQESFVHTAADIKRAYWALVSARAAVEVQQRSLELARELARNNQARVDVGQLPPLDLVAAQAEVAQREEALIVAEAGVRQAEDRLRTLVLDPEDPQFWTVRIEPADTVPRLAPPPDVDEAIRAALQERADLDRTRTEIENARTSVSYFTNQRLPDVRLQASYLASGVGGTRLLRGGGFPGTVVGFEQTSFGSVLDQVLGREFPTWTVGLTISYPIGQSFEEANLARARLEETQAKARLKSLEIKAVREIRDAGWQIEMNAKRIAATRAARELAERRLDAEQKRFEVGLSTSFLVVQAQRDLAQARNNELGALLSYERSLIDFEALQKAGPSQGNGNGGGAPAAEASAAPAGAPVHAAATPRTQSRTGFPPQ